MKQSESDNTPTEHADVARRIRRAFVRAFDLNLKPDNSSICGPDLSSVAGLDWPAMLGFVAGLEEEFHIQIEADQLTIEFLGDLEVMTAYFAERLHESPQDP